LILVLKTLINEISKCDDAYDVPYNKIYAPYFNNRDMDDPFPKNLERDYPLGFEKVKRLGGKFSEPSYMHSQAAKEVPKESPVELFESQQQKYQSPDRINYNKHNITSTPQKGSMSKSRGNMMVSRSPQGRGMISRSPKRHGIPKGFEDK